MCGMTTVGLSVAVIALVVAAIYLFRLPAGRDSSEVGTKIQFGGSRATGRFSRGRILGWLMRRR
jgi:hypothetical protein